MVESTDTAQSTIPAPKTTAATPEHTPTGNHSKQQYETCLKQ